MSAAKIDIKNASVCIPIFNAKSWSLKSKFLNIFINKNKKKSNIVTVNAINNINLTINQGDRIGIIGNNGAGKSTLLRVISKIYNPTTGSAIIKGRINSLININLGLDVEATGRDNIILRLTLMGLSKSEIDKKITKIIDFTELHDFINLPFYTYSSGMQLRLAFATATAIESEILVMDEWLAIGDKDFLVKSNERLKKLSDNAHILVLASHDKNLILQNCTRAIWLKNGSIFKDGPAETIVNEYFN